MSSLWSISHLKLSQLLTIVKWFSDNHNLDYNLTHIKHTWADSVINLCALLCEMLSVIFCFLFLSFMFLICVNIAANFVHFLRFQRTSPQYRPHFIHSFNLWLVVNSFSIFCLFYFSVHRVIFALFKYHKVYLFVFCCIFFSSFLFPSRT